MRITKKALSIILAIAMLITAVPMMNITGFAADVSVGTETTSVNTAQSDTLIRPNVTVSVTPVTRVAASASTPMKGTTGAGVTIAATPSGIPKVSYAYVSAAYAGETPTATTVVFTTSTAIDASSLAISCSNTNVTLSGPTVSGNTYTWTVNDGCAASVGETLQFNITYKYSYTDSQTGKTYNSDKVFTTTGYSYVDSVVEPAGSYMKRRTNNGWGGTRGRTYLANYILGEATYTESTTSGSVNFSGGGSTYDYGKMFIASDNSDYDDDGNKDQVNVSFKADSNRPVTHVYMDRSSNSTLADLNLRMTIFAPSESDESDEIPTVTVGSYGEYSGFIDMYESDINNDFIGGTATSDLLLQPFTGSMGNVGTFATSYFTGTGPAHSSTTADTSASYTYNIRYNTPTSQRDEIKMSFSHNMTITVFDKTSVRTNTQKVMNTEATNLLITTGATDGKGYNPQEWYYSSGWQAFDYAYDQAMSIYAKPNTTQADITTAANNLLNAYNGLVLKEADYTDLDYWVSRAATYDQNLYTVASWAALQTALSKYQDNINILYQPTVDQMALDVETAINNLEEADADYTAVDAKVDEVNTLIYDTPSNYGYTVEEFYSNWADLKAVVESCGYTYDEAEGAFVLTNPLKKSKQTTVDTYPSAIANAIAALKKNSADFTDADAAMTRCNNFKTEYSYYLDSTYLTSLNAAYNTVNTYKVQNATLEYQAELDDAVAALNSLIDNPVWKDATYTEADKAIASYNALERDIYKDLTAVDAAYEALIALYGLDARSQTEINTATSNLNAAIKALEKIDADYTVVNEAIARVDDKKLETQQLYGMEASAYYSNWSAVETAINNVNWSLDYTQQATIDNYAKAIDNAVAALKANLASYTTLNTLEETAYALLENEDDFTPESVENLMNALLAVTSYNLTIDKQATVDGWANDLDAAIKAMEYVEADYSSVTAANTAAQAKLDESQAFADAHNGVQYYSAETLQAVNDAMNAVVYGLKKDQQTTVDAYATAINNAVALLVAGPADYTAVNAAVAKVPADLSKYTDASVSTLNLALAYNTTYTTARQSRVDDIATKIEAAIAGLQLKALDTSAYDAIVIPEADLYTVDSYAYVTASNDAIVDFLAAERTVEDQTEFNALVDTLVAAIDALDYKPIDVTPLDNAFATVPTDLSVYTDASVADMNDAYDACVAYAESHDIRYQAEFEALVAEYAAKIAALEFKPIDTTAYEAAQATVPADLSVYTDDSVQAVTDAQSAIDTFLAGDVNITNQAELDALVDAYVEAISKLEEKTTAYFQANADSTCVISSGYITGLQTKLTAATLKSTYLDFEGVTVTIKAVTGRYLGTGSTVTVEYPDGTTEVYTIIIYGDFNGDGSINATDSLGVTQKVALGQSFTAIEKKAMNINGDRSVNMSDAKKLDDIVSGGSSLNQVNPAK